MGRSRVLDDVFVRQDSIGHLRQRPEAQVDLFMLKLKLTYPSKEDELVILDRMSAIEPNLSIEAVLGSSDLFALRHALGKADAAPADGPPVLVAADTIVDVDTVAMNKPRDAADAKRMLRTLAGRWHVVHTGFAVVDRAAKKSIAGVESSRVKFAPLDEGAIERYVATGEPLDKAGGYGIQGHGAWLVERVDGDFYTVMGLPLARVGTALRDLGYDVWA